MSNYADNPETGKHLSELPQDTTVRLEPRIENPEIAQMDLDMIGRFANTAREKAGIRGITEVTAEHEQPHHTDAQIEGNSRSTSS